MVSDRPYSKSDFLDSLSFSPFVKYTETTLLKMPGYPLPIILGWRCVSPQTVNKLRRCDRAAASNSILQLAD